MQENDFQVEKEKEIFIEQKLKEAEKLGTPIPKGIREVAIVLLSGLLQLDLIKAEEIKIVKKNIIAVDGQEIITWQEEQNEQEE